MEREEREAMRLGICKQLGLQYYAQYTEPQAAAALKLDPSTLKRWRAAKKIRPVVLPGGKNIRYFGFMVADIAMGITGEDGAPDAGVSAGPSGSPPPLSPSTLAAQALSAAPRGKGK